jgi:Big-like domain-containing protein
MPRRSTLQFFCCKTFVVRNLTILLSITLWLSLCAGGQTSVTTNRHDNGRTGLNPNETLLTPQNVNKNQFGKLFNRSVDGYIVGQPLYLQNLNIGGKLHNVVFVATLHDSVYAFDADHNTGSDASPLWQVNFTNPGAGITTAIGAFLPCAGVHRFPESGIVSTPVIDAASGTLYVVAKTNDNGTVFHRLHALDVTTGAERTNSPVPIKATFRTNGGALLQVNNLHQMNRPALLLSNGVVYVAMGSNGCNDSNNSWVIGYDATTLAQTGAFVAAPEHGLGSIWQSGAGPAADADGNVYVSTAEAEFDANTGGQDYGSSVLRLTPSGNNLPLADYFTPFDESSLSTNDLDLSAGGVVALPDQPGPHPHLLISAGKQGRVYLLDRDNMGQFNPINNSQIVQQLPIGVGAMFSTPAYWNGKVYFNGKSKPIMAFALTNGLLSSTAVFKSVQSQAGAHAPTISANNNSNGILWTLPGGQLNAYDASNLKLLYNSKQAGTRDVLPSLAHFASQTVVNGHVYIGTQNSLEVFGLLSTISVNGGNNQSVTVTKTLPVPLSVKAIDVYSGNPLPGIQITFSDGGKGGTFGNATPVTNVSGIASTTYTFGTKARTITITATSPGLSGTTFTETAVADAPKWIVVVSGNNQTAPTNTMLAAPLVAKVVDQYSNPVSGIPVTFSDGTAGGILSSTIVSTNTAGTASVTYETGPNAGTANVTATIAGKTPLKFVVTVTSP